MQTAFPSSRQERPRDAARRSRDIRARLAQATVELHRLTDIQAGAYDLRAEGGLRGMLQFMMDGVSPVEAALERAGIRSVLPEWPARRRAPLLRQDGAEMTGNRTAAFASEAEMWGALYVLEGSRLGARLMARTACGRSGFLDAAAADGFWPEFLSRLREAHERLMDPEGMERGARAAFSAFLPPATYQTG